MNLMNFFLAIPLVFALIFIAYIFGRENEFVRNWLFLIYVVCAALLVRCLTPRLPHVGVPKNHSCGVQDGKR